MIARPTVCVSEGSANACMAGLVRFVRNPLVAQTTVPGMVAALRDPASVMLVGPEMIAQLEAASTAAHSMESVIRGLVTVILNGLVLTVPLMPCAQLRRRMQSAAVTAPAPKAVVSVTVGGLALIATLSSVPRIAATMVLVTMAHVTVRRATLAKLAIASHANMAVAHTDVVTASLDCAGAMLATLGQVVRG